MTQAFSYKQILFDCVYLIMLFDFCPANTKDSSLSSVTTLSLIETYGYPSEEHSVTTDDGYILGLFRIPYSPKIKRNNSDCVIFAMHGFAASSSDWVLVGAPRALAFILADEGCDVWLGNSRGTRYSQRHITMNPLEPLFWNFSWHEIGIYDLPALIEYVHKQTGVGKMQFIAHSQGATAYFVGSSTIPDFNKHLKSVHLLAPITFLSHATSPGVVVGGKLLGYPNALIPIFGTFELSSNTKLNQQLSDYFCNNALPVQQLCLYLMFIAAGFDSPYTNRSATTLYFDTVPNGESFKQLIHCLQLYNSGKFRQYDNGVILNYLLYNQASPPDYKLENVKGPLYLYHSDNDALNNLKDVETLLNHLQPSAVEKVYEVPYKMWNHIDFIMAYDVNHLFYSELVRDLKNASLLF